MSRALNKQLLFDEEIDYIRYLQILNNVKKEFGLIIYAYCLMSNHVHIVLKDSKNELSKAIRRLNSIYAMYYNKKNIRTGYVFSDRFKSESIETKEYLLTCIRYVHRNPVKAGICKRANQYKFTSIHAYKSESGNYLKLVNVRPVLKLFNNGDFLKWNDEESDEQCMDITFNKLSDAEVIRELLNIAKLKKINDFRKLDEPVKMIMILKMIDRGIPMMQLSRITGIYYSKIQKLKKGQNGKIVGLTYFN